MERCIFYKADSCEFLLAGFLPLSGIWCSPPVSGTRPPPCGDFSLTMIAQHLAVLFGGYQSSLYRTSNYVYMLDVRGMVSSGYDFLVWLGLWIMEEIAGLCCFPIPFPPVLHGFRLFFHCSPIDPELSDFFFEHFVATPLKGLCVLPKKGSVKLWLHVA